jgi:predicted small lipoprotein YifL
VRRAAAWLLLASWVCAVLACGKYGPPVRADQKDRPSTSAEPESDEAKP